MPNGSQAKKRRALESKKKKYWDLNNEYTRTRYALFYADDIVQTMREVQQLADKIDSKFERDLREQKGIFFDVNVRPTSPRKNKIMENVLVPFSRDPNKEKSDNSASDNSSAMKNFGQSFYNHENDIYRHQSTFGRAFLGPAPEQQESPTFK